MNYNLNMDIVQANLDKPWNWGTLSINPNLTWEFIEANFDKDWNWERLSENDNLTWDIVRANLDKPWDWQYLSRNPMLKHKKTFIEELRLKIIKSNIIKRYWKKYTWDPAYPFAQKMILKRAEII